MSKFNPVEFVDAVRELLGLDPLPGVVCERTKIWRAEERDRRTVVYFTEQHAPIRRRAR